MKSNLFRLSVLMLLFSVASLCCRCAPTTEDTEYAAVEGNVWEDTNGNGNADTDEKTVSTEVRLYTSGGSLVQTTRTFNGHYSFEKSDDIKPGQYYYVEFGIPAGYHGVSKSPNSVPVDLSNGRSEVFQVDYQQGRYASLGLGKSASIEPPKQETIALFPLADTFASQYAPSTTHGDQDSLPLQNDTRVFMRFPLDTLPHTFDLMLATLHLHIRNSSNSADALAALTYPDPSASSWLEGALTWENMPPHAPGAPVLQSQLQGNTDAGARDEFDLTAVLQSRLEQNPDACYFDVVISYAQGEYIAQQWYSRESPIPPVLNVTYSYHP